MSTTQTQPDLEATGLKLLAQRVADRLVKAGEVINGLMIHIGTKSGHELQYLLDAAASELAGHQVGILDEHAQLTALLNPEPAPEAEGEVIIPKATDFFSAPTSADSATSETAASPATVSDSEPAATASPSDPVTSSPSPESSATEGGPTAG